MIAIFPWIAALIGLLLFVIPGVPPKLQRVGEILLFAGILVAVFTLAGHTVRLAPG